MTYAFIVNDVIQSVGALPRAARRQDSGAWVLGLRDYADEATRQACGYYAVTDTPQPSTAADEVAESTVELVDGVPTQQWTVRTLTDAELAARKPQPDPAQATLAALVVTPQLDTLPVDTLTAVAPLFPPWVPGVVVNAGDVLNWDGTLVRVIQGHTTQRDWTPDVVPALFTVYRPAGEVAPWVQPLGAQDAYAVGDRVTHNGSTWESTVNANVWEPGVFGWITV